MSWIALSRTHVESRLAADELAAIEETGGGDGERMVGIMEQVTALVRAKVAACHKNTLGASGLIPEECLHAACTLAKHDLLATLSSYAGEDTDLRKEEYREAQKFLNDVARCDIGISTENDTVVSGNDSGSYGGEPYHQF